MAPSVKVRLEVEGAPEAVAAVRAFANQSKSAGKEASAGFAGLSTALSGVTKLFAAYQVARVVADISRFTLETVKLAAEQKDLALSLGTTIGHFSALSAVAKSTNTEQTKLVSGLGILGDRIKDLRAGAPDVVRAFQQLGLGARDFASDDVIVNAAKVGEALEKVARGGTRGALATDALGKSGRALLPVFEKLNQLGGLEGATAFAKQLGFYVDASTIAAFDQIASSLQEMELRARGIALQFAKGFGPEVLIALRSLQTVMVDGKTSAEIFGEAIGNLARGVAELVVHTIAWGTVLGDIFSLKFKKAREDFDRFDKLLKEMKAAKPTATKPLDDAVGGPTAADVAARRAAALEKQIKLEKEYLDAEGDLQKASNDARTADNELNYQRGLISLEEYYKRRAKIITDELRKQFAAADALVNSLPEGMEKNIAIRRREVISQQIYALEAENTAQFESAAKNVDTLANSIRNNLAGALTSFLAAGINQVHSLTDAFRQLGYAIASAFQQALAAKFVSSLPFLKTPIAKAGGGLIMGPGTGTSDSIPAWVSTGEYIVRAGAVSQPGVLPLLQAVNSGGGSRLAALVRENFSYSARRTGFADGGLVQGPLASAASATVGGEILVALGEGLVVDAIKSPEGQRALLHVVGRNRRAFGQALQ